MLVGGERLYLYHSMCRCIDLEKVESVVEVESEAQAESTPERFCFNLVCSERTYQLQTDSDETRKQ